MQGTQQKVQSSATAPNLASKKEAEYETSEEQEAHTQNVMKKMYITTISIFTLPLLGFYIVLKFILPSYTNIDYGTKMVISGIVAVVIVVIIMVVFVVLALVEREPPI